MNTRYLPGGKGRSVRKADNITAICEPIVYKMWRPRRLTTLWVSMVCFTFYSFVAQFVGVFFLNIKQNNAKTTVIFMPTSLNGMNVSLYKASVENRILKFTFFGVTEKNVIS
jgi:hypothetical protein